MKKYISRVLLLLIGFLTVGHHLFWSMSSKTKDMKFNFADLILISPIFLIDLVFFIIIIMILILGVIIE